MVNLVDSVPLFLACSTDEGGVENMRVERGTLYSLGARKVAIFGLGKTGSAPMYASKGQTTIDSVNSATELADEKIKSLVDVLNKDQPGAKFIYLNMTSIALGDPTPFGIKVLDAPCCNVSTTIAAGQCIGGGVPCNNRAEHIFFDSFHPTEIANTLTAERAYKAVLPTDAYPYDISTLVIQNNTPNNIIQDFSSVNGS
ncbi:lipase [Lithospermum erythrorhizon]|uniref:Lipase n=1 Tax=Lithospermum erythrorhizon TaxID=34254 RepID=A0AAV3QU27_LITER